MGEGEPYFSLSRCEEHDDCTIAACAHGRERSCAAADDGGGWWQAASWRWRRRTAEGRVPGVERAVSLVLSRRRSPEPLAAVPAAAGRPPDALEH